MIMMGDRKKTLMQIMGPDPNEGGEKSPSDLESIAQDLISAVEAKDAAGVAAAFKAAFACCGDNPEGG